jgi:hypothetical protein
MRRKGGASQGLIGVLGFRHATTTTTLLPRFCEPVLQEASCVGGLLFFFLEQKVRRNKQRTSAAPSINLPSSWTTKEAATSDKHDEEPNS